MVSHPKTNTTNRSKRHIVSVRAEQEQNKNITIGEPHDQGLVFKWGSLVGISMPTTGATGTSPFVAGDVVFRPREFTTAITTWATVPYCATDFGNYGNPAIDHLSRVNDPNTGIGDICRHMGEVDGSQWRIPTAAEWQDLYGSDQQDKGQAVKLGGGWIIGNYYPLSGRAFGPRQNNVAIISNTQVDNADPYDDGAIFLPASGHRAWDNGAIWSIGLQGNSWSSTAQSAVNGYGMAFGSTTVWPQYSNPRAYGFSVRCIRE